LIGCGEARVDQIAETHALAKTAAQWPELPDDCRVKLSRAGQIGARLDSEYLRLSGLLKAQDARIERCAGWYDAQRAERAQ
jgi:hypothetical protein